MAFSVLEQVVEYDPARRLSWQEGGSWPHSNHFHFHEAAAAAHFTLLGYQVLRDYGLRPAKRATTTHATEILHSVVGPDVSAFLVSDAFSGATDDGSGLPDLFLFRALDPEADPKIKYADACPWFFVEVKGPGDRVQDNQKVFWRAIAEKYGPQHIRLVRTTPNGTICSPEEVTY